MLSKPRAGGFVFPDLRRKNIFIAGNTMNLSELQEVQTKFLCGYSVKSINFSKLFHDISWELQKMFLQQTVGNPLLVTKPISWSYQVAFLRVAIECLERSTSEVHEDFYTEYLRLQQLTSSEQTHVFKHYRVPNSPNFVSIRESPKLICDGTTGLRTWPASIALCEWFTHNCNSFVGKMMLELGAGVGMAGIMLGQMLAHCKIHLTDFHEKVLNILQKNVDDNPPANGNNLFVDQFDWTCEADYEKLCKTCCPDIVYASDVIYDSDIFPALCCVLVRFITSNHSPRVIISCSIRNEKTFADFVQEIENNGLMITKESLYDPNNFYWTDTDDIVILNVVKRLNVEHK